MEVTAAAAPVIPRLLHLQEWRAREAAHHERVDGLLAGHLERARHGVEHPVEDFLFTYYALRPAQLRRWHPGAGVALLGEAARERSGWRDHVLVDIPGGGRETTTEGDLRAAVTLDVRAFLARRGEAVRHVRALLAATPSRPPQLGCFR